jgi:hypothetical protein
MLIRRMLLVAVSSVITTALAGCGAPGGLTGLGPGSDDPRRSVVETYDAALVQRNDAIETRDTGIELFNAKEYAQAMESIEIAVRGYEEAEAGFAEAAELVTELAEAEAASICELARDEARLQIEATEAALAAATAAEEGADASPINKHIREFQEVEAEADALTVEDTEVLAETLGVQ